MAEIEFTGSHAEPSPFGQVGSSSSSAAAAVSNGNGHHSAGGSWDFSVGGRTSLGGRSSHDSIVGFTGLYPSLLHIPLSGEQILMDLQHKLSENASLKVFHRESEVEQWSRPVKIASSVPLLIPTATSNMPASTDNNPFDLKWSQLSSDEDLSFLLGQSRDIAVKRIRLYLVRHGQTAANHQRVLQGSGIDQDLNETGLKQSEHMASYIFQTSLKQYIDNGRPAEQLMLVSSHLKRARQTASAVKNHFQSNYKGSASVDIKHEIMSEFREISWGDWEGVSDPPGLVELIQRWNDGDFEAKSVGPSSESPMDCIRRTMPATVSLLHSHFRSLDIGGSKDVVVVTHGRLIRVVLAYLLSSGDLYQMSRYQHVNTCVNCLDIFELEADDNGNVQYLFVPLALNDHSHLQHL